MKLNPATELPTERQAGEVLKIKVPQSKEARYTNQIQHQGQ